MSKSVLVIDDDPRICRLIAMGFERQGYRVFEAANGRAGLKLFNAHHPDLVVTDILMPEMEGIATIMEMKKAGPSLTKGAPKIIAISGGGRLVGREFLKWARHLGADDVMAKPFRISALVAMAEDLTGAAELDATPAAANQTVAPQSTLRMTPEIAAQPWEYRLDRRSACLAA